MLIYILHQLFLLAVIGFSNTKEICRNSVEKKMTKTDSSADLSVNYTFCKFCLFLYKKGKQNFCEAKKQVFYKAENVPNPVLR